MRYRHLDRSLTLLIFPLMVVASACGKAPATNAIGRGTSSTNVADGAGAVRRRPPDPCTTIGDGKSGYLRLPSGVYPVSSKSDSHLTIGQLGCTWTIGSRNVLLAWIRTSESADLPVLEPILPAKDRIKVKMPGMDIRIQGPPGFFAIEGVYRGVDIYLSLSAKRHLPIDVYVTLVKRALMRGRGRSALRPMKRRDSDATNEPIPVSRCPGEGAEAD